MVDCHFWEDEDYCFYNETTKSMRVDDDINNAGDKHDDRRCCLLLSIALIEIEELV